MRILFFLLLFVPALCFAQDDSTHQSVKIQTVISYVYESDYLFGKIPAHLPDTIISDKDKVNPPYDLHYNYLGINGSAAESMIFTPSHPVYTRTGINSYDLYMITPEQIPFYKTNKRYTEVDYHTGAFKENGISVFHTQNISKYFNAGLYFERMSVKDFMNFSDTYRSKFGFFAWYHSPNSRYAVFASALWNTIKNDVNGGLQSDSLFENTSVTNLGIKGLAYELSNAAERSRRKTFTASQYFDVGKAIRDTAGKVTGRNTYLRLQYKIQAERRSFTYRDTDADSSFYNNFYYGVGTLDSLHSDEVINRFALQKPAGAFGRSAFMRNWSQGIFAELENMKYGQRSDTSWHNVSGGANVFWKKDSSAASFSGEAKYVFDGFDKENYDVTLHFNSPEFKFGQLSVSAMTNRKSPDYFYRSYDGNNFRWLNNFRKINYNMLSASYRLPKYRLEITSSQYHINNFVYLDETALPQQFDNNFIVSQTSFALNLVYRNLHLDNILIFQKSSSEHALRLPPVISENNLYLQKHYFNNALYMATGIRFVYSSKYFADAFMPATAGFYLQNEKKTGGYLRTDIYIDAQIKTAVIFLKFENAFDGLSGKSYFTTPHYPMPGRVFRFGVKWKFFD